MKILILFSCLLLFAGCKVDLSSIESGITREGWVSFNSPDKTELSSLQIKAFAEWFEDHQQGWKYKISDPAPKRIILFKHKNGKATIVNLQSSTVWVGNYYRALTREERDELQAILDTVFLPPSSSKRG